MTRLVLALLTVASAANAATCRLRGSVVDPSGSVVAGAAISLLSPMRLILATAMSGPVGEFAIDAAPCGAHILTASSDGMSEQRFAVELTPRRDTALTVRLSLVPVEEQITVTAGANRVEDASDASQRVNVIARSALAERAKSVLTEAANGETGVNEQRTAPAMGSFFVRGFTGNKVSVYRDGFRYTTSAQRGGVSTFQNLIDPAALDSIEILRGPNSAQYGSDSIGGTVNLLSAYPLDSRTGFRGETTQLVDSSAMAFGGTALAAWSNSFADLVLITSGRRINRLRSAGSLDGHSAVTRYLGLPASILGARLQDTAFTQYGGSLHGQFRLTPRRALAFHYERGQQDGAKRYDQLNGGDGNLIADLRNLMLDFGYLRYTEFAAGPFSQVSIGASYNTQREERVNQGGQGNSRGTITHQYERNKSWGVNLLAEKQAGSHTIVLGGEAYRERMVAPAYTFNPVSLAVQSSRPRVPDGARYLSHGLYVQDTWDALPRVRLSGAVRFGGASYHAPGDSLAANAVTGRIGGTVRIAGPLSAHAHYSRGFRAPNMTDLGTLGLQGNGFFEANVNDVIGRDALVGDRRVERLRPETSNNFDAGLQLRTARVRAEFTAFSIDLGNSIVSQTMLLPQGAVGQSLGDQIITRQIASGAVYVPLSPQPVQVRANIFGARMLGFEQSLRVRLTQRLTLNQNLTWLRAEEEGSRRPPDIEPGVPPLTINPSVLYTHPARRFWAEIYATVAGRQDRLSTLALGDRRIGASRSRTDIANFFNNGATARGLVAGGRLLATGESLDQVQSRVLGPAASAPLFTAIPGYGVVGARVGVPMGERSDVFLDFSNLADKSYRGIGWGVDGAGRAVAVRFRTRF